MSNILTYLLLTFSSYAVGSFPASYVYGKLTRDIDIRDFGSGNVGATNVYRTLGKAAGGIVLLVDIAKGMLAVFALAPLALRLSPELDLMRAKLLAGLFSILGHIFSPALNFRGGKGVATSAGVLLGVAPLALGLSAAIWLIVVLLSHYVCLGSILAVVSLPLFVWVSRGETELMLFSFILAGIIIARHSSNIKRLLKGEEKKIH